MLNMQQIVPIYEDNHLLVVNKPSGLLVQGDNTGDVTLPDLAKEFLKEKYNKPGNIFCGVVHRLDRPVSGVVVLAKTSKGLERMNALFKTRHIQKIYWAITEKKPANTEGTLIHWLVKDSQKNVVKAYHKEVAGSQIAQLSYRYIKSMGNFHLIEIRPLTGRSHQIRVQLASMGCVIVGDLKYGAKSPNPDAGICLHARRLVFEHPIKLEPIDITAELPKNHPVWTMFQ
jgi:23S rRNA pseudouridine1911/1915/1917 synthase